MGSGSSFDYQALRRASNEKNSAYYLDRRTLVFCCLLHDRYEINGGNRLDVVINVVAAVEAAMDSGQHRWLKWPIFTALIAQGGRFNSLFLQP